MIRLARTAEAGAIRMLIARAYAPWRVALPDLPDVTEGIETEISEARLWVAVTGDRIMGILNARSDGVSYHVMNVAVDPDAMGRGHGRALLEHAKSEARRSGCSRMLLATHAGMTGNVAMYEALGWSVTTRDERRVRMRYDLDLA